MEILRCPHLPTDEKKKKQQKTMDPGRVIAVLVLARLVVSWTSAWEGAIIDGRENGSVALPCLLRYSRLLTTWTLTTNDNETLHLGTCGAESGSCESRYNDIALETYAILFRNIQRDKGGQLTCSTTVNNRTESYVQLLNVYHLPVMDNCTISTILSNWTATITCDLTSAFSTADMYTFQMQEAFLSSCDSEYQASSCLWFRTYSEPSSLPCRCVHHGRISYSQSLTAYINDTDNKQYYRGQVQYSWPLTPCVADIWTVRIYICAGLELQSCVNVERNVSFTVIDTPLQPRHNCTDVTYLPETGGGGGTSCMCSVKYLGRPTGRLVWKRGNATMATGEYGTRWLLLPNHAMTREQEREPVTCQVDWIQPRYATPSLNVAYGPDSVTLREYLHYDVNDNPLVTVECQVTRLNPVTPDMVQWEGPCRGQTGFTCTVNPQDTEVRGKVVRCRVTNPVNAGLTAEADMSIKAGVQGKCPGSDKMKWAAMGGGVMLALVVVLGLLVILGVCVYRRSLHCCNPLYDSPRKRVKQRQNTSDPDTHSYETLTTTDSPQDGSWFQLRSRDASPE